MKSKKAAISAMLARKLLYPSKVKLEHFAIFKIYIYYFLQMIIVFIKLIPELAEALLKGTISTTNPENAICSFTEDATEIVTISKAKKNAKSPANLNLKIEAATLKRLLKMILANWSRTLDLAEHLLPDISSTANLENAKCSFTEAVPEIATISNLLMIVKKHASTI